MYNLDFLSSPPQISFLQKDANQTFFGGFLFIIYIIIMIGISAIYVLNYFLNDKYDISYSLIKNSEEDINKSKNDTELDPEINFSFDLLKLNIFKGNDTKLSKNFLLIDGNKGIIIERKSIIKQRPSDVFIMIAYVCNDDNCTLNENDTTDFSYFLQINYTGFKIDHQNNDIPLETNNPNVVFNEEYPFLFGHTTIGMINWEIIKYKEERGIMGLFDPIFDIKSQYISGEIESYISANSENAEELLLPYEHGYIKTKILGIFKIVNEHKQYKEYKREKVSILDVVANIGALFSTVFACFLFGFQFYSKNYDNYKIIEHILSLKQPKINKKTTNIELDDQINEPNNKNEDKNNTSKSEPFIINNSPSEINVNQNEDEKIDKEKEINLEKLTFKHFILNSFYSNCFKFQKEHTILEICNDVLAKYSSIELLLYNQILFENLIKDYKWNNPELRNIDNNEFLYKLKNIG